MQLENGNEHARGAVFVFVTIVIKSDYDTWGIYRRKRQANTSCTKETIHYSEQINYGPVCPVKIASHFIIPVRGDFQRLITSIYIYLHVQVVPV